MGENTDRDYIGEQIGWSVRKILPPTPQINKIDKLIMRSLPKPVARVVALLRFEKGWLPETGNPSRMFTEMSRSLGSLYLDELYKGGIANTVLMPAIGEPLRIHSKTYKEGDKEVTLDWKNQVSWAQEIKNRSQKGEQIQVTDLVESDNILSINQKLGESLERSKSDFVKRGLPLPELPKIDLKP